MSGQDKLCSEFLVVKWGTRKPFQELFPSIIYEAPGRADRMLPQEEQEALSGRVSSSGPHHLRSEMDTALSRLGKCTIPLPNEAIHHI